MLGVIIYHKYRNGSLSWVLDVTIRMHRAVRKCITLHQLRNGHMPVLYKMPPHMPYLGIDAPDASGLAAERRRWVSEQRVVTVVVTDHALLLVLEQGGRAEGGL